VRPRDFAALVLLGALWGATFLFVRIAGPSLGPFVLTATRFLLAGAATFSVAAAFGARPRLRARWRGYLILGSANAALPSVLLVVATLELNASLAAILNATGPVWAALVAAVWLREPLTGSRIFGLVLGIVGIGLLAGWSPIPLDLGFVVGVVFTTLAMFCYAIGAAYASKAFREVPSPTIAAGQLLAAGLVLLPPALLTLPSERPSERVVLTLLALAFVSTALAYGLYFRLLRSVGPTKTSSVTFLIPGFGILWGVVFLDESINLGTVLGLAVILAGVVLVTEFRLRTPSRARAGAAAGVVETAAGTGGGQQT
jgi:drug/metabolite transporter (DMT)-like permease